MCRKTGLVTDSSLRFERGVDPTLSLQALEIALGIIESHDSGAKIRSLQSYQAEKDTQKKILSLEVNKLEQLLGKKIDNEELSIVIKLLGGNLKGSLLTLPSFSHRYDLELSCDLAEEVMRVHHALYPEKILKAEKIKLPQSSHDWPLDFFVHRGFFEVMSFGFTARKKAEVFAPSTSLIEVANPISEELAVMNPSLLPQLADIASKAHAHRFKSVNLVELAWIFDKNYPQYQKEVISGLILEQSSKEAWQCTQTVISPFYKLKGLVLSLGESLNQTWNIEKCDYSFYEQGYSWNIIEDQNVIGHFGVLAISLCQQFSWPTQMWSFQLDKACIKKKKKIYQEFSRYPKISRDLSFYWNEPFSVDFLLKFIQNKKTGDGNLSSVSIFDYFVDKITKKISVGLRLIYQSHNKTLTDKEVDSELEELTRELMNEFSLQQRQ
jgi:phenylalanyl-tRNA synthetase beta chain